MNPERRCEAREPAPAVRTEASVRIAGIAWELPALTLEVEALQAQGLLDSTAAELRRAGFGWCHVADAPAADMALHAVERLLEDTGTAPSSVQLLLSANVMPVNAVVPRTDQPSPVRLEDCTRFASTRIQAELGLVQARTLGVGELGCASLMGAVSLAHAWMDSSGWDTAICVNADVMPAGSPREVLCCVNSDVACAVLLKRGHEGHILRGHGHMTKGHYWDHLQRRDELLAAYYPTARRVINNTLARHGLTLDDIACVMPNNVSRSSWEALCDVLRLPTSRVWLDNIPRRGHCMGADPFMNLHDAVQAGRVKTGDLALLFGFGLGAHWACSVVEI
jgi:3-oxoacyl-[acyl-carrier-protein] synthase-3